MRPSKPVRYEEISIHAPLAGRDRLSLGLDSELVEISIHAPLAGRDGAPTSDLQAATKFQSTRPLRGATSHTLLPEVRLSISIHAPLAGRDLRARFGHVHRAVFQSTRPLRGATETYFEYGHFGISISIHAPLAGRDANCMITISTRSISIHAPLAGRDHMLEDGYLCN